MYKSRFFTAALAVTIVAMASVAAPGDPVGPPCDPSFASDKLFVS